jgi:YfiH family protein
MKRSTTGCGRLVPTSSASGSHESRVAGRETPLAGPVPRFELESWRELHGVVAGITGRGEGSPGFDLGLWTMQPVGQVMQRWRDLRRSLPDFHAQVFAIQCHGTDVAWHQSSGYGWRILESLDGHATSSTGLLLAVSVADCIPVYLVDPGARVVALLHAGWRGTAGRILARGVEAMVAHGAQPDRIVMHAGVGICGDCYEVGREVMEGCGLDTPGEGPWHLDLRQVLADQAAAIGINRVSISSYCSAHDEGLFFSHRRSRGTDGRMVAYLGILP